MQDTTQKLLFEALQLLVRVLTDALLVAVIRAVRDALTFAVRPCALQAVMMTVLDTSLTSVIEALTFVVSVTLTPALQCA